MTLILFYDGFCPLCMMEMRKLKALDKHRRLAFVDIQSPQFAAEYPDLDYEALNARMHGMLENGQMLDGLDLFYHAWKLVGHGWVYAPLRWPVIKWFADRAYLVFARHRYTISYLLTGQKRCTRCQPMTLDN